MASEQADEASSTGRLAVRSRPVRLLASAALLFHLAAITVANVSRDTALGSGFHRPFDLYTATFRLDQTWDMFTTIPHFYDMDGTVVVIDEAGRETHYGPMLPGLLPYRKDPRIHSMFMRLAFMADAYPSFSQRYLAVLCRAIAQKTGVTPHQVAFDLHTRQLRRLSDVRVDGRVADSNVSRYGPSVCPH
jgi:hypothetical protein